MEEEEQPHPPLPLQPLFLRSDATNSVARWTTAVRPAC